MNAAPNTKHYKKSLKIFCEVPRIKMAAFVFPTVLACCICLSLRVGCLVIGYISLFLGCCFLALLSTSLYKVVYYVNSHAGDSNPDHTPEQLQKQALYQYLIHGYFMTVCIYYLVLSVLLLVAAHRKTPRFMKWYFKAGLGLLLLVSSMVVISFVFLGFIPTIPMLAWNVLIFYFLVVVRSTYLEMEENEKPQTYEMNRLFIGQAYS